MAMTLRAQIELMTVPQEFTRLCNAVLIAEYGDDFLPIDDDRADRGNDGYLKSEKRMFAAHCFKRIQSQQLDAPIRAKMIGDLGKAIALKQADAWPIEAWTFLSNYPIPEELAAEVSTIGRKTGIDVAWRGPDYFANALAARPEVAENFPALQITEISQKLARIEDEVVQRKSLPSTPDEAPRSGLATTQEEKLALALEQPPGWEFLLFASVLRERRDALEPKWRSHELALPSRARRYVDDDEIASFVSLAVSRLGSIIEPLTRVFEGQEAAFGAPGEPGDPVRIEHFANWIMGAYEDMLDWGAELRAADVSDTFERTLELASKCADRPLGNIREFVDDLIGRVQEIPAYLELPESEREANPLRIEATLVVTADEALMAETVDELRRAVGLDDDAVES
jgi:hypothetical protein